MAHATVRNAYSARAEEYVQALGSIEATAEADRALIRGWARGVDGRILDVGCGPGHWTALLEADGAEIEGVDPVPDFVESARARHPGVRYRLGRAERLDAEDGGLAGILAWYSLIHIEPERLGAAIDEFARALRPGGGLLLGFFEGPAVEAFDHAVTTAYRWPVPALEAVLAERGFAVTARETRADPGARPHGAIAAVRAAGEANLP